MYICTQSIGVNLAPLPALNSDSDTPANRPPRHLESHRDPPTYDRMVMTPDHISRLHQARRASCQPLRRKHSSLFQYEMHFSAVVQDSE